jgi:hypothetical protein
VDGADTALDGFGFKIWRDTAEGLVAESDSIGSGSITGSNSYTKYVTPDTDYYFEEVSWPASVLSPSLVYTETNAANKVLLKDGKVLFVARTGSAETGARPWWLTMSPTRGTMTITKRDSKTEGALAGATFKISVPASGLSDGVKALLESKALRWMPPRVTTHLRPPRPTRRDGHSSSTFPCMMGRRNLLRFRGDRSGDPPEG